MYSLGIHEYFEWQWNLGSCYGPPPGQQYLGPDKIYYDRCCLAPGQHTLTCSNTKSQYGWGNVGLEIDGKKYCDDFYGYQTMRKVTVQGKQMVKLNQKYGDCNLILL